MSLSALRQQLAAVVAGTPSTTPGLPVGMAALDALLPGGGIPVGRITELVATLGFGKTTITRSLVQATITAGHCVAWIDATRTLDPRDFLGPTSDLPSRTGELTSRAQSFPGPALDLDALWVIRPPEPSRAPWCADLVLRTGAFALVVLDGAPVLPRAVAVRLAQLARDADAALLLLGEGTRASEIGGALRLVMKRRGSVTLEKGGPHQHVLLRLPDPEATHERNHVTLAQGSVAHRLRAHPEIPDRRSVARSRNRRSRR